MSRDDLVSVDKRDHAEAAELFHDYAKKIPQGRKEDLLNLSGNRTAGAACVLQKAF